MTPSSAPTPPAVAVEASPVARPPTLTQWLQAVPTPNRAVREQFRPAPGRGCPEAAADPSGDLVTLFVPLRRRWWTAGPVGWLLPLRTERGVALDALGTWVWRACDGQRSVESVVEAFAELHELGFHEARLTVTMFLQKLAQRRLLVLIGPTRDASAGSPSAAGTT